ncbi:MAG: glutathione peroxidase [Ignavibacteriales bacterium]|nr:glutathione peroxidase [Ignavibacteriales bacterium]
MKSGIVFILLASLLLCGCFKTVSKPDGTASKSSIYSYSITDINGKKLQLESFRGKKILIVNTASKCGFTPQYEGLEALYKKYGGKLIVLGFPANDFMSQEPGSNEEIAAFCKQNYGVTFLLAEKSIVSGEQKSPIFTWLTDKNLNGWNSQEPKWNFYKYLISETGELLAVYPSQKKPEEITELQ